MGQLCIGRVWIVGGLEGAGPTGGGEAWRALCLAVLGRGWFHRGFGLEEG